MLEPNSAHDSSTPNHLNFPEVDVGDEAAEVVLVLDVVDVARVVEAFVVVVVMVVVAVPGTHWE